MFYNFLKPKEVFEEAINTDDYSGAVLIAFVAAAILFVAAFLYSNDLYASFFTGLTLLIQWYVLTAILYSFEFMVKNKRRKITEKTFREIATGTGRLWTIPLILMVLVLATVILNNEVISLLVVLAFSVLSLLYLYNLYVLIKVTLQSTTKRTVVAWILAIILHSLIVLTILIVLGIIF